MSESPVGTTRLPKQFWRVVMLDPKARMYDRGSKTYAAEGHANRAYDDFVKRGIRSEIYTTGPVTWDKVTPTAPEDLGMEAMF